jgi:hypothetical protein
VPLWRRRMNAASEGVGPKVNINCGRACPLELILHAAKSWMLSVLAGTCPPRYALSRCFDSARPDGPRIGALYGLRNGSRTAPALMDR